MAEWTTSFNWPGTCFPDKSADGWIKQVRETAANVSTSSGFPGILTNGNWTSADNAKTENGTYATVTISPGTFVPPNVGRSNFQGGTNWLVATDFAFDIPAGATIKAISLAVKFTQSVEPLLSGGGATIYDFGAVKAGNVFTLCDATFASPRPGGSAETPEYWRPLQGGEFAGVGYDLGSGAAIPTIWTAAFWQSPPAFAVKPQFVNPTTGVAETFTDVEVNDSSFGAAIALGLDPYLANEDGTAVTFNVDAFQVAVYYIGAAEEPQIFITT